MKSSRRERRRTAHTAIRTTFTSFQLTYNLKQPRNYHYNTNNYHQKDTVILELRPEQKKLKSYDKNKTAKRTDLNLAIFAIINLI